MKKVWERWTRCQLNYHNSPISYHAWNISYHTYNWYENREKLLLLQALPSLCVIFYVHHDILIFRDGDIIIELNGEAISSLSQAITKIEKIRASRGSFRFKVWLSISRNTGTSSYPKMDRNQRSSAQFIAQFGSKHNTINTEPVHVQTTLLELVSFEVDYPIKTNIWEGWFKWYDYTTNTKSNRFQICLFPSVSDRALIPVLYIYSCVMEIYIMIIFFCRFDGQKLIQKHLLTLRCKNCKENLQQGDDQKFNMLCYSVVEWLREWRASPYLLWILNFSKTTWLEDWVLAL